MGLTSSAELVAALLAEAKGADELLGSLALRGVERSAADVDGMDSGSHGGLAEGLFGLATGPVPSSGRRILLGITGL